MCSFCFWNQMHSPSYSANLFCMRTPSHHMYSCVPAVYEFCCDWRLSVAKATLLFRSDMETCHFETVASEAMHLVARRSDMKLQTGSASQCQAQRAQQLLLPNCVYMLLQAHLQEHHDINSQPCPDTCSGSVWLDKSALTELVGTHQCLLVPTCLSRLELTDIHL